MEHQTVVALTKELSAYTPTKPRNNVQERRKLDRRLLVRVEKILNKTEKVFTAYQQKKLIQALHYAASKHAGKYRKDLCTPYFHHPLEVAVIIIDFGIIDFKTIVAAILHDVVEDEGVTLKEIAKLFGASVRNIVDLVSKNEFNKKEYWLRMKYEPDLTLTWRVIVLKFADRIHYFMTSDAVSKESKERKLKETLLEFPELYIVIKRALERLHEKRTFKDKVLMSKIPRSVLRKLLREIKKHP